MYYIIGTFVVILGLTVWVLRLRRTLRKAWAETRGAHVKRIEQGLLTIKYIERVHELRQELALSRRATVAMMEHHESRALQ